MKLDPPMLVRGPLSGRIYVVTHGKVVPGSNPEDKVIVEASTKYDVTDQFQALMAENSEETPE